MKRRTAAGALVIGILTLSFIILPAFLPDAGAMDLDERLLAPCAQHVFGTDTLGRDVFARVMEGGRVSLAIGAVTTLLTCLVALPMGLACMHDGPLDAVLMRLCDVFKALPSTLLALFLSVAMGGGAAGIVIALSIVDIPQTARLVRARARVVDASLFVMAKRSAGIGEVRILACTVLPHVLHSLLVQCAFVFSSSILAEAALSFIGAGLPMGQASWGTILAEARGVIHQAWWMVVFPTLFVFLSTLSVNLVADGLEED